MTTPVKVYDRIYLSYPGRYPQGQLVIEYIDGYCDVLEKWLDEWRLIDLSTGEVFEKSDIPHDVIHAAAHLTDRWKDSNCYIVEKPPAPELRKFDDIPLKDKIRHVQSHAQDLEHDFNLEGDCQCPLAAALRDYQQRYNDEPCFYNDEDGNWEIYEGCC